MSISRTYLRVLVPALAALLVLALAATAQADYEQVGLFGQSGNGEQLSFATGIAVNTTGAGGVEAGSVYVGAGQRISRYGPTGEFKEDWGWNTVESGPDQANELQSLTVEATAGTYTLSAITAGGGGEATEGSKLITDVYTNYGAFRVGDAVSGDRIPPGATIAAVGAGTLELSVAAESTGAVGGLADLETTAPIQATASAADLKAALVALPAFEATDFTVTGGPGDAEGTSPYEVTFEGTYVATNVGQIAATNVSLASGNPSSSVAVETINQGAIGYERCRPGNGDTCAPQIGNGGFHEEALGYFEGPQGVAVDQSTGYVYVLNRGVPTNHYREHNLIEVFNADGSKSIARFGDAGASDESFETGAAKIHGASGGEIGIAVNSDGNVYLNDNRSNTNEARVMCFRPETLGDYEHYVYCGRSQDVNLTAGGNYFEYVALDDADHVYVGTQQFIGEYSLAEPSAPALCTLNVAGQARGTTVNPVTGEVFFFNSTGSDQKLRRLKTCNPAKGKFEEAQAPIEVSPLTKSSGPRALAINPTLTWGPERPSGVLYGADPARHTGATPAYNGLGYIFAPAEVHPPSVESESVSNTRTTSTILRAEIDPHGFVTRYVFQYLPEAEYEANEPGERFAGAMEAPAGGGEIGGGSVGQATAAITGLSPDTAYVFRVLASSECDEGTAEPCGAEGEAAPFATYPLFPPGLPDHRAYELVSPAQKHGGEVIPAAPSIKSSGCGECKPNGFGAVFPMQTTPDGEALAYQGTPFSLTEASVNFGAYVARRTETGWQTTALSPALQTIKAGHVTFDASLGKGLLFETGIGAGSPTNANLYAQDTAEPGALAPLVTEANHRGASEFGISYAAHSADFSRIFFAANDSLTKETPFAPEPPDPGIAKSDLYEWHNGQLALVNVLPGNAAVASGGAVNSGGEPLSSISAPLIASPSPDAHAVSEDGSRVFFEDEAGNLYLRESGEATRLINDSGHFLSASPDGSEVLLTDGCLYSVESESCTDLTEGHGGFQGLVGQGKDLSHIYFVDAAALGSGEANEAGEVAEVGKDNLYAWSEGEVRFVAILLATDNRESAGVEDWAATPAARTAEASPEGRFLAFASKASLTGYDNVGPCEQEFNKEIKEYETVPSPCAEAFLYDSATGKLTCASCNPTGEAPLGNTTLRRIETTTPVEHFPQPRYLTDEGRLYFDSQDSLVARDTNEGYEDVYEYEPKGAGGEGTCQREAGCTRLISAGTEPDDSNLIAVDESGKNVFFDTRDQLSLKDKDELVDIYDAREGGGIPAETEIARAECQGENCQAPASPPNDPTPASSSFEGAGNVKEAPAAKKHKHAKKHKKAKKHARTAKRNHGGAK